MSFALVIDDNQQTARALVEMLTLLGVAGRTAFSPTAALQIVSHDTPEVIFLDVHMPGVDGFEVLSYLRREPRLEHTPVFVITSDDQPEMALRARQLGARGILLKPISLDMLENALREIGRIS
ncbi:MAG: response regulator [Anaerolineales bacterium]|nr:response regulator [Anaerolineales bacterium]MCX7609252.1 response regulator [Anaerolineales bacterium]